MWNGSTPLSSRCSETRLSAEATSGLHRTVIALRPAICGSISCLSSVGIAGDSAAGLLILAGLDGILSSAPNTNALASSVEIVVGVDTFDE